jgi:hypothetical protein
MVVLWLSCLNKQKSGHTNIVIMTMENLAMKEFEIVDGVAKGHATASVEISFDIPLGELHHLFASADNQEDFLELIEDEIHYQVHRYIEEVIDNLGYVCSDDVCIDACNSVEIFGGIALEDVEVEVSETEND